jgi:K+-sensing histidine kinase KdpD
MTGASTRDREALLRSFPARDALATLAPARHIRPRPGSYLGDTLTLSILSIPEEHAAIVRRLYAFLHALRDFTAARRDRGIEALDELTAFLGRHRFDSLIQEWTALRAAMVAETTRDLVRKTYHDLRGGSLTSLVGYLEMVLAGEATPDELGRIFFLARDHLKIMRNAIHDLDQTAYAHDLRRELHSEELLREKWDWVAHHTERGTAHVVMDCEFSGSVSDRCMEFSSLDRVLYNLINNAAEHAADDVVLVRAFPIDEREATHLRFAVINRVREEQRAHLDAQLQGRFGRLFEGGFTTRGHGIGMSICGDIVTDSYGLRSVYEACERGYLGACILDGCFVAWFHWPARRASAGA